MVYLARFVKRVNIYPIIMKEQKTCFPEPYCAPEIGQDTILVAETLLFEGSFGFPDGTDDSDVYEEI